MKNIFLVKSPLQLINAVEARHYYALERNDCVLIIMGDRKSQPQILNLAGAMQEWGKIIVLNKVNLLSGDPVQLNPDDFTDVNDEKNQWSSKSIFNVWRLNRLSKALGPVNYIFVGYIRYVYMRHFVNTIRHQRVVLLDDGNATLQLAKDRINQNEDLSQLKKIKLWAKKWLQGIKPEYPESVRFFSVYPVNVAGNDELQLHNYEYLRSHISDNETNQNVYFLGTPLSVVGAMTDDEYIEHMTRVKCYFTGKKLRYIAHRRERKELLDHLKQQLELDIIHFDYPIEYQLAIIGPKPEILASFMSSGLDNCSYIFADKLNIVSFRLSLKNSPKKDQIDAIYQGYQSLISENFIVVHDY